MKISPYTIDELFGTQICPIVKAADELHAITKDATKDNPVTVGNCRHLAPYMTDDHNLAVLVMAAIRQDIADLRREVKKLAKRAKAKGGAK